MLNIVKPNFIIIGAPKCATSSILKYINQHNNIYVYEEDGIREMHYWNKLYNEKDITWYESKFKQGYVNGEKTPVYASNCDVPKRISKYYPNIKLIYIIRNPVDRIYSQYIMSKRIDSDCDNLTNYLNRQIINQSKYYSNLENYLKYFNKNQIKIIVFEEFIKNPLRYTNDIIKFIGLNPLNDLNDIIYNKGYDIDKQKKNELKSIVNRINTLNITDDWNRLLFSNKLLIASKNYSNLTNRYTQIMKHHKVDYKPIDKKLYNKLIKIFYIDINKMSEYLDKDLYKVWEKQRM